MGSIAGKEPQDRLASKSLIVDMVLNNLADIHGIPRGKMEEVMGPLDHVQSKVVAWYNEPNARGAFALFGPGQFGQTDKNGFSLFASLKAPAANGRLHIAGEATSIHHAWVVGALNSAWRAVYTACWDPKLRKELGDKWPVPMEENLYNADKIALYGKKALV